MHNWRHVWPVEMLCRVMQVSTRGDAVTVHTQLQVSENDMRLIGFSSAGEREWFRLLTGVQGVGSKMALAVLSALSAEELQRACAGGDATASHYAIACTHGLS